MTDEMQEPVESLGERIRKAREAVPLTQREVADQLGLTYQAISGWETGASRPSTENLRRFANVVGVDINLLLQGRHGNATERTNSVELTHSGFAQIVPVITVEGLTQDNVRGRMRQALEEDRVTSSFFQAGKNSFAFRIIDRSMEPQFKRGDLITIDMNLQPIPGDFVVAHCKDIGITVFRKYKFSSGRKIILEPLNLNFLPEEYDLADLDKTLILLGTMTSHTIPRRP